MTEILTKYLSGNASPDEVLQVKKWRNENTENANDFFELSNSWNLSATADSDNQDAFTAVLSKLKEDNQVNINQKSIVNSYFKYAAVLLVGIVASYLIYNSDFSDKQIAIQTSQKQTQEVLLPDGSKVFLSENSSLSYANDFEGNTREVLLTGKAFFDITRDESKPFIVKTDNSEIRVLGTSFLVDAHLESNTEVVVKTGKVSVAKKSNTNSNELIELLPGEAGLVTANIKKSINTNQNYLSWQTQIIDFNRTPMNEVIKTLEEVYFVDIKLSDEAISNCSLSAKFDHREISTVMEIVSQTFGLELSHKGKDKFTLSGEGCAAK